MNDEMSYPRPAITGGATEADTVCRVGGLLPVAPGKQEHSSCAWLSPRFWLPTVDDS